MFKFLSFLKMIKEVRDILAKQRADARRLSSRNPFNRYGMKCFSQGDEDGLTLEILRRLGFSGRGVFVEFGVGNGLENNALVLIASGWDGVWIGGQDLAFDIPTMRRSRFTFIKSWVHLENIIDLLRTGLSSIGSARIDVSSIGLDRNDLFFVQELLKSDFRPHLFIVEYNAKFRPRLKFTIQYDKNHRCWEAIILGLRCSLL